MRKMSTVFACVAILAMVTVASAGNINLAFVSTCQVPNTPGSQAPARNAVLGNPTIWLAPTDQVATLAARPAFQPVAAGGLGYDKNSLYVMMDVQCRADGVGNEIVSSMGLNVHKVAASGPDTTALSATAFSVNTTPGVVNNSQTGAAAGPWSAPSPNTPTLNAAGGLLVQNSRAVAVPASTTDALWTGYTPNRDSAGGQTNAGCGAGGRYAALGAGGHYNIAKLSLSSNTTGSTLAHAPTVFNVFMQVGALKITRVYDPTATNGGAPENVSFGVTGGEATVSGSTPGAESTNADAVVVIRRKGDFGSSDANGNPQQVPDGQVGSVDLNFFLGAINTTDPLKIFLGDFGSTDANGNPQSIMDCQVGSVDLNYFLNAINS